MFRIHLHLLIHKSNTMVDSSSALRVQIVSSTTPVDPEESLNTLTIQVTVHNVTDHAITILNWDSPLDLQAGILGVFQCRDVETGESLKGKELKFNRLIPPSSECLAEIASGGEVQNIAVLKDMNMTSGRAYEIVATGEWRGVWDRPKLDVGKHIKENFETAEAGRFHSNSIIVRAN